MNGCWTNVERSVQSTPFNICENKGDFVWMLNKSLNRFKFDSTRSQQTFFKIFNYGIRIDQSSSVLACTKSSRNTGDKDIHIVYDVFRGLLFLFVVVVVVVLVVF